MHETAATWMGSPNWGALLSTSLFFISISQTFIALSAVFRVARSTWPKPIQPILESGIMFMPIAFILLIAVLVGRNEIFYWLHQEHSDYWSNVPHLAFRTLISNLVFYLLGIAMFFKGKSLSQRGSIILGTFTLIAFFIVQTLLSWDFGTNLEHHWHPSVFGPLFIVGNLQVGMAAAILACAFLRGSPLGSRFNTEQFNFMGQLMLGFTFVWIYSLFSLYLVTWYGNLPYETTPVNLRIWHWAPRMFWTMMTVKLFIPFFMLINTQVRNSVPALSCVALLVLVGGFLEKYLIVVPGVHPEPIHFDGGVILRLALIAGGILVAGLVTWRVFLRRHRVLETA